MDLPDAPLVVFVPGLGLDGREWAGVAAALRGRGEAVLLPSQGRPAGRDVDLSVEAQGRRVARWLAEQPGGRRAVLVGHSEGCAVAVETAARTERVAGLVLVGPVTDPSARSWPQTLQRWLRTALHERPGELRTLLPQYARTGLGSLLRGHHAMRWYPVAEVLAPLTLPVAVVHGEYDRIPSAAWVTELLDGPRRSSVVVARAAHMVPLTHPHAVAMAVHRVSSGPAPPS